MKHLLITGASGHIGRKLAPHFAAAGYRLTCLDINGDGEIVFKADLSDWRGAWRAKLESVDCVIHLAGCARPDGDWRDIQSANLDATMNVLEASAQAGVARVVFASSNWVLAGHRWDDVALNAQTSPAPTNAYGMSKLAGERMGLAYANAGRLSFIALRIGYSQHGDKPGPGPHMAWGLWGQQMWLSEADLRRGFACAVAAPADLGFAVVNLVSNNAGMRWDLTEAANTIGFTPQDYSIPVCTDEIAAHDDRARQSHSAIADFETLSLSQRW